MQAVYELLIELGVKDENIYAESFGPASLTGIETKDSNNTAPGFETVDEAEVSFDKAKL